MEGHTAVEYFATSFIHSFIHSHRWYNEQSEREYLYLCLKMFYTWRWKQCPVSWILCSGLTLKASEQTGRGMLLGDMYILISENVCCRNKGIEFLLSCHYKYIKKVQRQHSTLKSSRNPVCNYRSQNRNVSVLLPSAPNLVIYSLSIVKLISCLNLLQKWDFWLG